MRIARSKARARRFGWHRAQLFDDSDKSPFSSSFEYCFSGKHVLQINFTFVFVLNVSLEKVNWFQLFKPTVTFSVISIKLQIKYNSYFIVTNKNYLSWFRDRKRSSLQKGYLLRCPAVGHYVDRKIMPYFPKQPVVISIPTIVDDLETILNTEVR